MFNSSSSSSSGGAGKKKDGKKRGKKVFTRKKIHFPECPENVIDYKLPKTLSMFLTERGKILPRRVTGLDRQRQTQLVMAIKRARHLALLPYTVTHFISE